MTNTNNHEIIHSRLGLGAWLAIISIGLLVILSVFFVVQGYIDVGGVNPLEPSALLKWFFALFLSLTLIWIILNTKVEVGQKGIKSRLGTRRREIAWADVISLEVPHFNGWTPGLGYNIVLISEQHKPTTITAFAFSNGHTIAKAIIEASTRANPKVHVDQMLLNSYGLPPYGIFDSKPFNSKITVGRWNN